MVTKYISTRQKLNDYLKSIVRNPDFKAERSFFVANICIDMGVKKELVEEILKSYIDAGVLYSEFGFISNVKLRDEKEKSEAMKEADAEFKKMGI